MAKVKQLPGSFYCRKERWWWRVKVPGEDKNSARPLKPIEARFATKDRVVAEEVAKHLW